MPSDKTLWFRADDEFIELATRAYVDTLVAGVGGGSSGIAFDVDNIGGSLNVHTSTAGAGGYAINLASSAAGGGINIESDTQLRLVGNTGMTVDSGDLIDVTGGSIHLTSVGGEITFEADAYVHFHTDSFFSVIAHEYISLYSQTQDVELEAASGHKVSLLNGSNYLKVEGNGINLSVGVSGTPAFSAMEKFFIAAATLVRIPGPTSSLDGRFRVEDDGGNAIFEVRADGSVHIRTSTSPVADL